MIVWFDNFSSLLLLSWLGEKSRLFLRKDLHRNALQTNLLICISTWAGFVNVWTGFERQVWKYLMNIHGTACFFFFFVPVYENAIVTDLSSVCFVSMKEYHNIGPMSQILMTRYYILETRSFHLHSVEAETRALIIFCLLSPIPHIHHL